MHTQPVRQLKQQQTILQLILQHIEAAWHHSLYHYITSHFCCCFIFEKISNLTFKLVIYMLAVLCVIPHVIKSSSPSNEHFFFQIQQLHIHIFPHILFREPTEANAAFHSYITHRCFRVSLSNIMKQYVQSWERQNTHWCSAAIWKCSEEPAENKTMSMLNAENLKPRQMGITWCVIPLIHITVLLIWWPVRCN